MAALTQRHEIVFIVRTAVCQRQDVMHFLGGSQPAFAFALLAQRMRLNVLQSNPSPHATVSLVGVRIALIFVVMASGDLPVLIAVPSVGQPTTTGVGAGTLRFSRHRSLL